MNGDEKFFTSSICTCHNKISRKQLSEDKFKAKCDTNTSDDTINAHNFRPYSGVPKKNLIKSSSSYCRTGICEDEVQIHRAKANLSLTTRSKIDNKQDARYFSAYSKKEDILFKINSLKNRLNYFENKFQNLDLQRRGLQKTINCFYFGNPKSRTTENFDNYNHKRINSTFTDSEPKYIDNSTSCCIKNDSSKKVQGRDKNCWLLISDTDSSTNNKIKQKDSVKLRVNKTKKENCTASRISNAVDENHGSSKSKCDIHKTLVELKSMTEKLDSSLDASNRLFHNADHANSQIMLCYMNNIMENILAATPLTLRKWQYLELAQVVNQLEVKIDKLTRVVEKSLCNESKSNNNNLKRSKRLDDKAATKPLPDTKLFPLPPENWFKRNPRLQPVLIINEPIPSKVIQSLIQSGK